jgi:YHS domain-containing protein
MPIVIHPTKFFQAALFFCSQKRIMKKVFFSLIAIIVVVAGAYLLFFKEPTFKAKGGYLNNINSQNVIIEGYDPVSYFTDSRPSKGFAKFSVEYHGATYWFTSLEHAQLFKKDPTQYAPQYGAFCGYAVSIGKLRPVDPKIFQIENGRLILQHTQEAYDLFNKNLKRSIEKADEHWPAIVATHIGKPVEYDEKAKPTASSN